MNRLEQLLNFYEENPDDAFVRYCIALEKVKTGEQDEGLKWYNDLIDDHPDYIATYYHLGKLHEEMGNQELAVEIYAEGLKVAQRIGDNHAYSELMNARNELVNDYNVEFDD